MSRLEAYCINADCVVVAVVMTVDGEFKPFHWKCPLCGNNLESDDHQEERTLPLSEAGRQKLRELDLLVRPVKGIQ